jgi:peptidoglycan hydrolase FlgJ
VSISPPSDIILDVARAADPDRYRVAADRLTRMGSASPSEKADFAAIFGALTGSATASGSPGVSARAQSVSDRLLHAEWHGSEAHSGPASAETAQRDLEGMLLQNVIESILPKDSGGLYGGGVAGGMWRSVLAEQIGAQIARSGGIGIAGRLFKTHPIAAGASVSHDALAASLNSHAALKPVSEAPGMTVPALPRRT